MKKQDILKKIEEAENIPTLSSVTTKLMNMKRATVSMTKLKQVISTDPVVATTILKLANSAYYGGSHRIDNLQLALVKIGLDEIYKIVIKIGIFKSFKNFNTVFFDIKQFWIHSAIVAFLSEKLLKEFKMDKIISPNSVYTAALCHDIGKLILMRLYDDEYKQIIKFIVKNHVTSFIAEKKMIGVTHNEVGGWVLESWNFPKTLCDPIINHHYPQKSSGSKEISAIVSLANFTAHKLGISPFKISVNMFIPRIALNILKHKNMTFNYSKFQNQIVTEVMRQKRFVSSLLLSSR